MYKTEQGSQTQIHPGATFGWKTSLRAAMWKSMPYLVQNLATFDHLFCLSMVKISNFFGFKESRGPLAHLAGHMFETPDIERQSECMCKR
jgi:hypothetical protein